MLTLVGDGATAVLDPACGADILSFVDHTTGIDVLFETPWRERADAVHAGQRPLAFDTKSRWLEQYRGGWQTLCPHAGEAATVHGAVAGYHGEASLVPWTVGEAGTDHATLTVDLFSVPVTIWRHIRLTGRTLTVEDHLTNQSPADLHLTYVQHPALSAQLLTGDCRIDTGARTFVPNLAEDFAEQGFTWPWVTTADGQTWDLRRVPGPSEQRAVFGWLEDFESHWFSVANSDVGLGVRGEWDGDHLPNAWFWQELNASAEFPWFERARTLALEPSTSPTRSDVPGGLALEGGETTTITMSLAIESL
ncbi:hypothetical protein V2J52_14300 [Georgenia sp. MJ173]|uniref:DUF4432 family protein n=1 Tax=Georgenia sunbinii TaxID=3117728 RepID=UPI002F26C46D